jgi:hypothetical protein
MVRLGPGAGLTQAVERTLEGGWCADSSGNFGTLIADRVDAGSAGSVVWIGWRSVSCCRAFVHLSSGSVEQGHQCVACSWSTGSAARVRFCTSLATRA